MSKIKLAFEVVEDLKRLAESIEALVKVIGAKDEAAVKAEEPKEEQVTIERVRAVLADKSQAGKQPQVKALIIKYGANKLTDIDPACYRELLKEAEVL